MVSMDLDKLPGELFGTFPMQQQLQKLAVEPADQVVTNFRVGCRATEAHVAWWLKQFEPDQPRTRVDFHADGADWVYAHLPVVEKLIEAA